MTDRELLEAAAKATGNYYGEWSERTNAFRIRYAGEWREWNPLDDDGDAFRLAVMLDIELYQADDDGPCAYAGYWGKPQRRDVTRIFAIEPLGADPYAATRRAIVRAAAALGEGDE
jgi:hypothetical protein